MKDLVGGLLGRTPCEVLPRYIESGHCPKASLPSGPRVGRLQGTAWEDPLGKTFGRTPGRTPWEGAFWKDPLGGHPDPSPWEDSLGGCCLGGPPGRTPWPNAQGGLSGRTPWEGLLGRTPLGRPLGGSSSRVNVKHGFGSSSRCNAKQRSYLLSNTFFFCFFGTP